MKQEVNKMVFIFFSLILEEIEIEKERVRHTQTLRVMEYMESWRPGCEVATGKASTGLPCVSDISVKPCTVASPFSSGLGAMQFGGMMDPEQVSLLVLVVVAVVILL